MEHLSKTAAYTTGGIPIPHPPPQQQPDPAREQPRPVAAYGSVSPLPPSGPVFFSVPPTPAGPDASGNGADPAGYPHPVYPATPDRSDRAAQPGLGIYPHAAVPPGMYAVSPAGSVSPTPNSEASPNPNGYAIVPPGSGYGPGGFLSPAQGYGFFGSPAVGNPYGVGVPGLLSPGPQPYMASPGGNSSHGPGRTVYVGDLPAEASVDELLSLVKFGPIESVRILPEKACAFISFLDPSTAAAFHADACVKHLSLHSTELKIGWGKNTPVPQQVALAAQQSHATRNVYLGNLEDSWTEEALRDELSRFGLIDQVKVVRDRNIAFVHFLSIATAMKVVATLPTEPAWHDKRVNYGKDRCAYVPRSQQQNQAHNHQAAAMGYAAAASLGYSASMGNLPSPYAGFAPEPFHGSENQREGEERPPAALAAAAAATAAAALSQLGNRTVYLGNIHSETTTEEICNHVRGGLLQTIRYIPEKHIAFVTFVDPHAALAFFHMASYSGVMIHNRRLKIGWGKHSGPLSPAIAMAVQAGGSRNVYVGNITDPVLHTEEKLRRDFGDFGEIEQVNFLREKNCAFVNFCNIQNAIKAIGAMRNHPDYETTKISYGKDRCGNPPRSVLQQVQAQSAPRSHQMDENDGPHGLAGTRTNPGLGVSVPALETTDTLSPPGPKTIPV